MHAQCIAVASVTRSAGLLACPATCKRRCQLHNSFSRAGHPDVQRVVDKEADLRAYNGGIHVHQPNKCVWDVKDVCFYMLKTPRIAFSSYGEADFCYRTDRNFLAAPRAGENSRFWNAWNAIKLAPTSAHKVQLNSLTSTLKGGQLTYRHKQ